MCLLARLPLPLPPRPTADATPGCGPRVAQVTFGFAGCSLCKADVSHPSLAALTEPIFALREDVRQKALMRLKYEGLESHPDIATPGARYYRDPAGFAMHKFAYYLCYKCQVWRLAALCWLPRPL
jgi:hypothetical protein